MAAYTVTKEIKFGYRVNRRAFSAVIADSRSSLLLELKIKDGVYAKLANYTFTSSVGPNAAHHYSEILTRGTTLRFTVTDNVDYFIDESNLT